MSRSESKQIMQSKCDVFNELHPVGSDVIVINDFGEKIETKIKYAAQILSNHTAVVWIEGKSGCYSLNRVIG